MLTIVAVAVFATRALWEPGALAGHSAWFDLTRMMVFDAAIRGGDWLPAWSPDFYHGYGSPLFQFYAPLTYYLTEIPVLLGVGFATALKITQAFALLASGAVMFRFATPRLSAWGAALAAIFYMLAPYRMVDIYVRHALAEHCAFVWLPLIAWGTERFVADRSRSGFVVGALAAAGLILTHNILALIGLPVCVAAGWMLGAREWKMAPVFRASVPALFGVGLAAFFWWPALGGRALTHGPEALTEGYFDVFGNFATLPRLLSPAWGFGGSSDAGPGAMSVQIGVVHLLAVGAALLIALVWRGRGVAAEKRVRWIAAGVATLGLAAGMCLSISQPVWKALPLLAYVQFPWRFLGLAVFGAAMCGGALVDRFGGGSGRRAIGIFAASVAVGLIAYGPFCREAWYLAADVRTGEMVRVRANLLQAGLRSGRLASIDSVLTSEAIRASGQRATSDDDFLPRGVVEKPMVPPTEPLAVSAGRIVSWTQAGPNHYRATLSLPEPGTVELRQFWFPGWTTRVNGAPAETVPRGPMALVSCALPAGESVVEFRYLHLPQRHFGLFLSALAVGGMLWLALLFPAVHPPPRPR